MKHDFVVEGVEHLTGSTILLNLIQPHDDRLFSFQPGQYAAISFKRHRRPTPARCFSIVNSPTRQGVLQFSTRTRGRFTSSLAQLKKGDIVKVRGPFGGFVLDLAGSEDAVLLAGGIGITPFMSMINYAAAVRATNRITLFYSCQTQDDIPFLHDLVHLESLNPNFHAVFVIADGPTDKLHGQTVAKGRITPELLDHTLKDSYKKQFFYICGPPPFMKALVGTIKAKGVEKGRILTEAFAQGPHRQTGKIMSWPYNIYVLSAIGVLVGSFVVLVSDMFKTLPPSTLFDPNSITTKERLTNALNSSRQQQLDELVNNFPAFKTTAPVSAAVKSAMAAAAKTAKTAKSSGSTASAGSQQTTSSGTSTGAQSTTQTTTSAPPPKTCTTTQSGVTVCN